MSFGGTFWTRQISQPPGCHCGSELSDIFLFLESPNAAIFSWPTEVGAGSSKWWKCIAFQLGRQRFCQLAAPAIFKCRIRTPGDTFHPSWMETKMSPHNRVEVRKLPNVLKQANYPGLDYPRETVMVLTSIWGELPISRVPCEFTSEIDFMFWSWNIHVEVFSNSIKVRWWKATEAGIKVLSVPCRPLVRTKHRKVILVSMVIWEALFDALSAHGNG